MFENGELEELDYSCWFILLVASAVYMQRSVLSLSMASFHIFCSEWSNSQKCWLWEQNQGKILRLS